jgi:hypothetical protein
MAAVFVRLDVEWDRFLEVLLVVRVSASRRRLSVLLRTALGEAGGASPGPLRVPSRLSDSRSSSQEGTVRAVQARVRSVSESCSTKRVMELALIRLVACLRTRQNSVVLLPSLDEYVHRSLYTDK